jgi:acid phosphatase type 7
VLAPHTLPIEAYERAWCEIRLLGRSIEANGATMWLRRLVATGWFVAWSSGSLLSGLAQETPFSAALQHGACSDLGDIVAPLTTSVRPTGAWHGQDAALPATSSFTTVPVSLAALGTSEHAIVIASPAGERVVACGDLGGRLTEAGALVIGLRSAQDSGITGIAFLQPSDDSAQTDISLFVTDASEDARTGPRDAAASQVAEGTLSAPTPSAMVVAVGDIACGQDTPHAPCRDDSVARLTEALHPDAVLLLGDIQYECGELFDYEAFFETYWGSLKPILHPVAGHHEYQVDDEPDEPCFGLPEGAPGYWSYFGSAATPLDPECRLSCAGYYSFDLGGWHLIALNSMCNKIGGCEAGSPQEQWLRADLAAHPSPCTLAFLHDPRFTSGRAGDALELQPLWDALVDAGADLVLAAHDHHYERFIPMDSRGQPDSERGLRSFVVGTGGRSHLQLPEVRHSGSEVANDTTFGVLRLELHDGWYAWEFVPEIGPGTDATAAFTDAGSSVCHD